jgi:ribonuclease P protein component
MHTLPKASRLSDAADIQSMFKQGKACATKHFVFLYKKNPHNIPRLAIAIKRKRFKNIVKRNQCQRWLKECFRHSKDQTKHLDVLILGRKHIKQFNDLSYNEVTAQWQTFLRQKKSPAR